ncbi:hypothetical protein PI126_g2992 [Phytophthora idaei]|nr:hypothetical protein PI126_g2992 [Phytophthora idaei]
MRVYMKAKPQKWGTKLFMLCSAHTAYCIRFEYKEWKDGKLRHLNQERCVRIRLATAAGNGGARKKHRQPSG